ncbi:OB-fold domain-containing protein [Actinomycetospora endophytica]|uniref:OB-fold domain-containing protein n=1 Tax=Actinomycetospora endophytica TaxID=2291215 RepID=A0ABS8PBH2_9PSEU|nr:OB-fold domain-containing protein [Actinomycetospora endophytica]MCD2195343.1 OB-fold domain-containing protein [Actinomycetospora endophytica]
MTATTSPTTDEKPRRDAPPEGYDPRPRVTDGIEPAVVGTRCTACAHPTLEDVERCPVCGGPTRPTTFARTGTVFSGTVLRIPVGDRQPPISLAYIDLDDGPRVLGHGQDPERVLRPHERVTLVGETDEGDPAFAADGESR